MSERVFVLPDLGEGLEEAVISSWLVAEGDAVELNQPIAEIETAKAVVEMPSPFAGTIEALHAEAGATVRVGDPLVTFEVPEVVGAAAPPEAGPATVATGPRSTPAVRKLAKDLGVEVSGVEGTGPGGRITRDDVERAASPAEAADDVEVVPVSTLRRTIARNLEEIARIPQVTTFREVDCSALESVRAELRVSPLPVFVRALAEIAAEHPWINASWAGERILLHRLVHVGVATATDAGLVVPVLRDARSRGIGDIADEIARLAEAARTSSLAHEELAGATIAVSNTGSYGSESGTPLLNPGHAVTVALGAIRPRGLVVEGRVEPRPACTISCTFDHRVLDGATVGRALTSLVQLLTSRERLAALPR